MSRNVQVVILCEDRQHEAFARRFLERAGKDVRVQRVEISGSVVYGNDKLCGTQRKCIVIADASRLLHEFSCWCAERARLMLSGP